MPDPSARKWQALSILLTCCLAGSLILNYKLFRTTSLFYKRELEMRLSPLELDQPIPLPTGVLSAKKVVFFGDSRAQQWTPPQVNAQFLNLGINGQTTAQILGRIPQLSKQNPDIVVIQAGVNDLKAISVLPARADQIVAGVKTNLAAIVSEVKGMNAVPIVTTIFPRGPVSSGDKFRWNTDSEKAIRDVNAAIRKSYPDCLDAAKILSPSESELIPGVGFDLLHLNASGYELLNIELKKRLDKEIYLRQAESKPVVN